MSKSREETPDQWSPLQPLVHVGADIYVHVGAGTEVGAKAAHVLVYHWHTPAGGPARWQCSRCSLHDVHSLDPLHLEASLACEDGCLSHGWIRDGKWVPA